MRYYHWLLVFSFCTNIPATYSAEEIDPTFNDFINDAQTKLSNAGSAPKQSCDEAKPNRKYNVDYNKCPVMKDLRQHFDDLVKRGFIHVINTDKEIDAKVKKAKDKFDHRIKTDPLLAIAVSGTASGAGWLLA
jgi:ElaB/YqjD/DUF883 family membrane-anchored ribosome-binding protein